jgi:hypothetical protein
MTNHWVDIKNADVVLVMGAGSIGGVAYNVAEGQKYIEDEHFCINNELIYK